MTGSIDYYFDSVSIDTKAIVSTMIISVASGKNYCGEQNRQQENRVKILSYRRLYNA